MQWITQGLPSKTINETITAFNILHQTYQRMKPINPHQFIQWLLETNTAANFQTQLPSLIEASQAKLLEKLVDKIQAWPPHQYQALLQPLSKLDQQDIPSDLIIPLIKPSHSTTAPAFDELSINLGATTNAQLILEGNDEIPSALNNANTNQNKAVSISIQGELQAKVAGEMPINIGNIAGYSELNATAQARILTLEDQNTLLINTLFNLLDKSPNPFDLSQIATAIQLPDSFQQIQLELTGGLKYGGSIKLGYKTQPAIKQILNTSVDIGYQANLNGSFIYQINKVDQHTIDVLITRGSSRSHNTSFEIGIELDASAIITEVTQRLHGKLQGGAQVLKDAIDSIEQLYLPDEFLANQITQSLKGFELSPSLLAASQLALGQGDATQTRQLLTNQILTNIQQHFFTWYDDVDGRAQHYLTIIAKQINIPISLLDPLKSQLIAAFEVFSQKIDQKITDFAQDKADQITALLQQLGIKVEKLTPSNQRLEQAKAGLIKLLTDLQNRIIQMSEKIIDKDHHELTAKLRSATASNAANKLLLHYRFDLNQPDLSQQQQCFKLLLTGKTDEIFTASQQHITEHIPGLSIISGTLHTHNNLETSDHLQLSLFGADIDYQSLLDIRTKLVKTANGDIECVSHTQYDKIFGALGIKQASQFVDMIHLATARNAQLAINFVLSLSDAKLSVNDVHHTIDELEKFQLITANQGNQLLDDYHQIAAGHKINGQITCRLVLEPFETEQLLAINQPNDHFLRFNQALNLQLPATRSIVKLEKIMRKKLKRHFKPELSFNQFIYQITDNDLLNIEPDLKLNSLLNKAYQDLKRFKHNADSYANMITVMREIYTADLSTLSSELLSEKQRQINGYLDPWLKSFSDVLQLFRPNLPNNSLGLAKLLLISSDIEQLSIEANFAGHTFVYP